METPSTRRSAVAAFTGDPHPGVSELAHSEKIGLKGPEVESWIKRHHLPWPAAIYEVLESDDGSLVARVGTGEVIVESEGPGKLVDQIEGLLEASAPGVYRVEQQSATLLLRGQDAPAICAQTCGVKLSREPTGKILYTRVAGISCGILPQGEGEARTYRLWVDYSYAPALYSTLVEIASDVSE
jgi:sarcosine oxidase gamma subunit